MNVNVKQNLMKTTHAGRPTHTRGGKIRGLSRLGLTMATTYTCGKTVVDVERVVEVVRSAGAAIMRVYTEDAKVGDGTKKQASRALYTCNDTFLFLHHWKSHALIFVFANCCFAICPFPLKYQKP